MENYPVLAKCLDSGFFKDRMKCTKKVGFEYIASHPELSEHFDQFDTAFRKQFNEWQIKMTKLIDEIINNKETKATLKVMKAEEKKISAEKKAEREEKKAIKEGRTVKGKEKKKRKSEPEPASDEDEPDPEPASDDDQKRVPKKNNTKKSKLDVEQESVSDDDEPVVPTKPTKTKSKSNIETPSTPKANYRPDEVSKLLVKCSEKNQFSVFSGGNPMKVSEVRYDEEHDKIHVEVQ